MILGYSNLVLCKISIIEGRVYGQVHIILICMMRILRTAKFDYIELGSLCCIDSVIKVPIGNKIHISFFFFSSVYRTKSFLYYVKALGL